MQATESLQLPESIGKRVDPTYSKVLQQRLKELLNSQNDSFPGSQPVSFESKHLTDIEREDYFVCEKSDGVRYLLFFLHSPKGPASFLFDKNKHWYYVPNLLFPVRGRENEFLKDTIMDGEIVLDIDAHKKTWRYLIFDLMVVNGSTIIQRSFSSRLGMLQQDIIQPYNARMRQIDPTKSPPFTIELKKMERSYGLHLVFEQIPKLKHKSDGIVFTPVKYPYTPGTCEKLLKWKPPELNTVDFRIAARWSKEHKPIYSIEVLSNGVTYKFYDHFQPEPSLATQWKNQLPDGRIAEFRYDPQCEVTIIEQGYAPTVRKGGWRFVRFRDDKSTANDEQVVKKILLSIHDGVTKEQLLSCMDRVRAAWKAREKGLPMPPSLPSKSPGNLTLSTQITPSASATNTPTSSTALQSPSLASTSGGYFRESHDESGRKNSISDESPKTTMKRKSSVASVTTPLKELMMEANEPAERKRLKSLVEEEPEQPPAPPPSASISSAPVTATSLPSVPVNAKDETSETKRPQKSQQLSPKQRLPKRLKLEETSRSRKTSLVDEKGPPDLQLPPSSLAKISKIPAATSFHPERTLSAPAVAARPEPAPTSESSKLEYDDNRRSKSIPQLQKETAMHPSKKAKLSSSIHNLLTTSVEPTSTKRPYDFSNILQQQPRQSPPTQQQQQQQQQQPLQQQIHHHQQLQQMQQQPHPQPVQFINFHAEGRQSPQQMNKNHVLIIRSESNSQSPTAAQQQQQQQQQQHHPQYQQQRIWKNSNNNSSNNVKYENQTPPPHIPPPPQDSYAPFNVVSTPYHLPPQNQQQYHPSYYGQYQPPPPQPQTPPLPPQTSMYGYRRNEQQVAHSYQQQQYQQQQQQQQQTQNTVRPSSSSPISPPRRKNSQKAKLDFILN